MEAMYLKLPQSIISVAILLTVTQPSVTLHVILKAGVIHGRFIHSYSLVRQLLSLPNEVVGVGVYLPAAT